MLRQRTKDKLIDDIYKKISELNDGAEFTVQDLFSDDEWNSYSIEKQRFMVSEFQYLIRTNFEENEYYYHTEFVELGEGKYKNETPVFDDNPLNFDEETSIQTLFHYTQYLVKEVLDKSERFQLKDLFPGFIWNRLTQKQKISLGILFQRYNEESNQEDYALVDITKQKQNVYAGLYDRYECIHSSHDAIDIKCRDFVPDPDKLSKILQITRKMKK